MKVNIVFLPSAHDFTVEQKGYLRETIRKAVRCAGNILSIKGLIDITIYPFFQYIGGKPWVVGVAQSKEWLQFTVPPEVYNKKDLLGTIYHEMHHMARGYCVLHSEIEQPGFLLNSIFSEGLATHFEMEQIVDYTPAYSCYNVTEVKAWLPKLKEEMWKINYDHQRWFFENGEELWMGYKIGKYLVDQIIKNNPRCNSVELVNTSAEKLLELSGVLI